MGVKCVIVAGLTAEFHLISISAPHLFSVICMSFLILEEILDN